MKKQRNHKKKNVVVKQSFKKSITRTTYWQRALAWCKAHYILTIAGFLISLLTFLYPVGMDYIEGKFGGRIVVGIGDVSLDQESPNYVFYSVPSSLKHDRYLVPIDLTILNDSKKSDSAVSLSIEFDKNNNRLAISEEFRKRGGTRPVTDIAHELSRRDNHDYSNYRIDFLSPGDSSSFTEAAFTTQVPLANQIKPLLATDTGMDIQVKTYSHNDIKRTWAMHFRGVQVHSAQAFEAWMKDWYAKQLAIEIREKSGFWDYFYRIFFSQDIVVYWFSPDFNFIQSLQLYAPKTDSYQYVGFKFNPYVWTLLFDF